MNIKVPDGRLVVAFLIAALAAVNASFGEPLAQSANRSQEAPPPSSGAGQPEPKQPHSVWEGVYTAEQAKRGEPLYYQACSSCHGDKLQGVDSAPALAGREFLEGWNGRTVFALFEKIRKRMPQDEPDAISREQKADILAYILNVNKFPAGKSELLPPADLLKETRIEPAKAEAAKPEPAKPDANQ